MTKEKSRKLIIYGDSEYAQMIAHYFQSDSLYDVVAFCVDRAYLSKERIGKIPVFALEDIKAAFSPGEYSLFAAIGYASVRRHKELYRRVAQLGYPMASYISSKAMVDSSAKIGENCLISAGVIVEPFSSIEANTFINSGAIVSHHSRIGAHSILAAGSLIGGYSSVGESSLIGFQATVAELLELGEETLLGAGSLLLEDSEAFTMYLGTPAKPVKCHREKGIEIIPKRLQQKD